jgi:hypothetical protein
VHLAFRFHVNFVHSYRGRQLAYPTRATGLGRLMALLTADHLAPMAPDYARRVQDFQLLLAPHDPRYDLVY